MRIHEVEVRRSRTLTDLLDAAVSLLRQDIAEYGFSGLLGAIAASMAAILLYLVGGPVAPALIAPAVFAIALLTYANAVAAIRRVQDNLEPDSIRAFIAVLSHLPALVATAVVPLAVTFAAVLGAISVDQYVGSELATTFAMAIIAAAALPPFQRALWVPALMARDATFEQANARGTEAMRAAGAIVAASFAIALAPAGLLALYALGTGFHVVATALAAFAYVGTMPLLGAIAALVFEHAAPQQQEPPARKSRQRKAPTAGAVQATLRRRMR